MYKMKMLSLAALATTAVALADLPAKEPNLQATKAMLDYLVSFKNVDVKSDNVRSVYTSQENGYQAENTYTENTAHIGKTTVTHTASAHHFGSDDYTQCSRYPGGPYIRNQYKCTIKDMPTELYTKLKQEADEKRIKGLVEKLSPETLTMLKHAFATNSYEITSIYKNLHVRFDTSTGLHPEVNNVMKKVKSDAKKMWFRQPSKTYERLRYLLTGYEAYALRYDEYSSFNCESLFMHPDWGFSCFVDNLSIHQGNIELLKKAVEQKVGKAVYPEKTAEKNKNQK